ncbi:MAG TPA: Type 1 glutamine amidotransferase-like domain-containing protein [Candidatus Saccharibacteria bacterium]|nr:Type 1 glutamine amidotransferase-like domain-containing protein [Candidatus Saccharibacteria bacterium]
MKLLLTSAGITNQSIAKALEELCSKSAEDVKVGFITTAANVEEGNKDWYINQFTNLHKYGFGWVDVVDPSAADVKWQKRLKDVDVVFVSGGNTFHLLNQYRKTGFEGWLRENLESKVYVGVSAGTIITTQSLDVCTIEPRDPNLPGLDDISGMNLVDFEVEPHCDEARFATVAAYATEHGKPVYAIDDQTAIQIIDGKVDVISEGKWQLCKPS